MNTMKEFRLSNILEEIFLASVDSTESICAEVSMELCFVTFLSPLFGFVKFLCEDLRLGKCVLREK